jgi:hypothetical protein
MIRPMHAAFSAVTASITSGVILTTGAVYLTAGT